MTLEIHSSRIRFAELLNLVDKALDTGKDIKIKRSLLSQNNNTIQFLKWLEKHKIISLIPIGVETPKKISIKSRKRKVEISLQLLALDIPIKEIAKSFNVKVATAQGYLNELGTYNKDYLEILRLVLKMKNIVPDSELSSFPLFPIRTNITALKEELSQNQYGKLIIKVKEMKYIKSVTGQKLGTTDLSILLPEKL